MVHQLYKEALMTHTALTNDDRIWLLTQFSSLSSNNARDILLSYKLSLTGRLAKRYNLTLDDIAKNRDVARLEKLYSLPFSQAIPELDMLNKADKEELMKRINLEYSAIKSLKPSSSHGKILPLSTDDIGKTPYCKSFKLLCFEDSPLNYTPSIISNRINIRDDDIYCFNRDELVKRFKEGNYNNPITNQPFSKPTLNLLLHTLAIDLKIDY